MSVVEVFHLGALGDGVMVWPLVRAMADARHTVELVAGGEPGRLAAREINGQLAGRPRSGTVNAVEIHAREFERWWVGEATTVREDVAEVVTFIADGEGGQRWLAAARASRPRARVTAVGGPGSASRRAEWARWSVAALGGVAPVRNRGGAVVLHVGAGSRPGGGDKRWPMDCWAALHARLAADPATVHGGVDVLAGPVELERWSEPERELFEFMALDRASSGVPRDLGALADILRGAAVVVCADSGPGHLAAQLGVAVVSLFGPSDAAVWAPVGPRVRVLAPAQATPMAWLAPELVREAVLATLAQP